MPCPRKFVSGFIDSSYVRRWRAFEPTAVVYSPARAHIFYPEIPRIFAPTTRCCQTCVCDYSRPRILSMLGHDGQISEITATDGQSRGRIMYGHITTFPGCPIIPYRFRCFVDLLR